MSKNKVAQKTDQRYYTMVYHDFLNSSLLTPSEKMLFIYIKMHTGKNGKSFPSIATLAKEMGVTKKTILRNMDALESKGVIKVEHRKIGNEYTSNLYTIYDMARIWGASTADEVKELTQNSLPYSDKELLDECERRGLIRNEGKEKEPVSSALPSEEKGSVTEVNNNLICNNNDNSEQNSCQPERYKMEDIHGKYDYGILITRADQRDVDAMMHLLYDTLNTTKPTIRVGKENRPVQVVKERIEKLNYEDILFAIDNIGKQKTKISNTRSYKLTALYYAHDDTYDFVKNQVAVDGAAE